MLLSGLQDAYTGTLLADADQNKAVFLADIVADVAKARMLSENLIKNALRLNIKVNSTHIVTGS